MGELTENVNGQKPSGDLSAIIHAIKYIIFEIESFAYNYYKPVTRYSLVVLSLCSLWILTLFLVQRFTVETVILGTGGTFLLGAVLYLVMHVLNITSPPAVPRIYASDTEFLSKCLDNCPSLSATYRPPLIWGRNPHFQTGIMGICGRFSWTYPDWERRFVEGKDGATVSYEVAEPANHEQKDDVTLVIVPGFANYSHTHYIRYLVVSAQNAGYRCVIYNHVGIPGDVQLSVPRLFNYANTDDLAAVVEEASRSYPNTKMLLVGCSMGGNHVTKYISEPRSRPQQVVGGISICQGYDVYRGLRCIPRLRGWRKLYCLGFSFLMKLFIMRNRKALFTADAKLKYDLDESKIVRAKNILELDELYSRRVAGFSDVFEYYKASSSCNYLKTLSLPLVCINARDDPLIPPRYADPIREFVAHHPKVMLVETEHGGHLGFFEGGVLFPNRTSWMDKVVFELAPVMFSYQQ